LLTTPGWATTAALYDPPARQARRLETITAVERRDLRQRPSRMNSWNTVLSVLRSRGPLRQLPAKPMGAEADSPREPHQQAEVASS
jgi:hypothetical protein